MRFREVDKILRKNGWFQVAQVGSHHQYRHPEKAGKITVPEHAGKDIRPEIVKKILQQAQIKQ
ncbi:MAG: type II toxin-antitoxin system HicA family toxin [Lachnospiraceae bacterium]|nr:type II toxin-antitoxin system HicA family toxin [Lachnospiraceae bacterium]